MLLDIEGGNVSWNAKITVRIDANKMATIGVGEFGTKSTYI